MKKKGRSLDHPPHSKKIYFNGTKCDLINMFIIDHPDPHFQLTAAHYLIWPSDKTRNTAATWRKGQIKQSLCLTLKLIYFYSNIKHTDPQRYAIPNTEGIVTESNMSHEKYCCTFCTVHYDTHIVNSYSDADWSKYSSSASPNLFLPSHVPSAPSCYCQERSLIACSCCPVEVYPCSPLQFNMQLKGVSLPLL